MKSKKKLAATGTVVRCPHCHGSGTVFESLTLRPEMCIECLGVGRLVRFESFEKERV
jgi:DnaJ-class molecular chaperone